MIQEGFDGRRRRAVWRTGIVRLFVPNLNVSHMTVKSCITWLPSQVSKPGSQVGPITQGTPRSLPSFYMSSISWSTPWPQCDKRLVASSDLNSSRNSAYCPGSFVWGFRCFFEASAFWISPIIIMKTSVVRPFFIWWCLQSRAPIVDAQTCVMSDFGSEFHTWSLSLTPLIQM